MPKRASSSGAPAGKPTERNFMKNTSIIKNIKNKTFNVRVLILVLAATLMASHRILAAGPAPVDLGSAAHFTILATSTITSPDGGIINGDVGLYPVGAQGIPTNHINGTVYNGDANGIAQQAQADLTAAINAASPAKLPGGINKGADLGGQTLFTGVYWSASSLEITGNLTLDGQGDPNAVWIFQMGSTLTTAAGGASAPPASQVILINGAQARNVFWQVGSSATLGTYSIFKGTIMAAGSITMNTGSTLDGRALAQGGAVTYDGAGGNLSTPAAPVFTGISRTTTNATVVLNTSPYFFVTLQSSPNLSLANWTTIATNTPATNIWSFTDTNATTTLTQDFYRAFITIP
jgi:hypothetical protein